MKARYERLVNIGLIRMVIPIIDFDKLETNTRGKLDIHTNIKLRNSKIAKNMPIQLNYGYCKDSVHGKPSILRIGSFERFFCCTSCKGPYKEK